MMRGPADEDPVSGDARSHATERPQVMVVEDVADLREAMAGILTDAGFDVVTAGDALSALQLVDEHPPDLVLLDLGLPGMDGLSALKELRSRSSVPVIVNSGRSSELTRLAAFEYGADDYITKPGTTGDLVARVRAVLRRASPAEGGTTLVWGPLCIDTRARQVTVAGEDVELTAVEYELLSHLSRHPRLAVFP
jgi:DNA-binding response OmpR family regulator